MLDHHIKYGIATYIFKSSQDADLLTIGIFDLPLDDVPKSEIFKLNDAIKIDNYINLESDKLGGGVCFPSRIKVKEILIKNHSQKIKKFIGEISQKNILIFDDKKMYSLPMLEIFLFFAKEVGKQVTCMTIQPYEFEGKRYIKMFDHFWDNIKSLSDKSIAYNFIDNYSSSHFSNSLNSNILNTKTNSLFLIS